jgi:hypothetical protein
MGEQYNYTQRQVYLSQQIILFDEELISRMLFSSTQGLKIIEEKELPLH